MKYCSACRLKIMERDQVSEEVHVLLLHEEYCKCDEFLLHMAQTIMNCYSYVQALKYFPGMSTAHLCLQQKVLGTFLRSLLELINSPLGVRLGLEESRKFSLFESAGGCIFET